jgi:hypothetical protein
MVQRYVWEKTIDLNPSSLGVHLQRLLNLNFCHMEMMFPLGYSAFFEKAAEALTQDGISVEVVIIKYRTFAMS